jgi:long-subunit acyl-CoA synthetase (AMP-forming)
MPIVTAYDTLGEDGLRHSLVSTEAKAIFLEPHLVKMVIKIFKKPRSIQYIIYNDSTEGINDADLAVLKTSYQHITVLSFRELKGLGDLHPVDLTPPGPEDICCIMYTSGSSGPPKVVPLEHRNVVAAGMTLPQNSIPSNLMQWPVQPASLEITLVPAMFFWHISLSYTSSNSFLRMLVCTGVDS